jgi:hypothetical protein
LAAALPKGSEARKGVLRLARSYKDYVDEKRKKGEKPMGKEQWEKRQEGEADEDEKPKGKEEGEKPSSGGAAVGAVKGHPMADDGQMKFLVKMLSGEEATDRDYIKEVKKSINGQMEQYAGRMSKEDFAAHDKFVGAIDKFLKTGSSEPRGLKAILASEGLIKQAAHPLKEGDILVSSWGYNQTNIDFYEVLAVTAATATIINIESRKVGESAPYNKVMPVPGKQKRSSSKAMRKRVRSDGSVKISSYANAYPWEGKPASETMSQYGH